MPARRPRLLDVVAGLLVVAIVLLGMAVDHTDRWYRALVADLCGVTVRRIIPSPDATAVLVTFNVNCGATTPLNTQISLLPSGAEFSRDAYPAFVAVEGARDFPVEWDGSRAIKIALPAGVQVYRQESQVGGIAVTYR